MSVTGPTAAQPVASLQTLLALCRDARSELIESIDRSEELRDLRWRVDRSPCLYALDAAGERLNDGAWTPWTRRRGDVEELLRRYPTAQQVIVDSGIDVAQNKEAHDACNYEPMFWQAIVWKHDAPVLSLQELDAIVRRRTAFSGFCVLLSAKGGYRPSFDMRDPEMAVLAQHYDAAMASRDDDRRGYRYGNTMDVVRELIARYRAMTRDVDPAGETVHARMSEGAVNAHFEPNTGGGVWLSHAVHRAGAHLLHVSASADCVYVYRAVHAKAEDCARAIWERCGEDDDVRLATFHVAASLLPAAGDDSDLEPEGMSP